MNDPLARDDDVDSLYNVREKFALIVRYNSDSQRAPFFFVYCRLAIDFLRFVMQNVT